MPKIYHAFVDPIADDPSIPGVTPSKWNAALQYGNDAGTGPGGSNATIRTKATANLNFYVAVTGNDANPGTLALPWATLQHAMDFISVNIDGGSFIGIVNIGVGSFAGVGCKSTIGLSNLLWLGSGSANTTITEGPNDGTFNFGENFTISVNVGCQVSLHGMNCVITDGNAGIAIYVAGGDFYIGNPITNPGPDFSFDVSGHVTGNTICFFPTDPGALIVTDNFGTIAITVNTNSTINSFVAVSNLSAFISLAGFNINGAATTLTISGNFGAGFASAVGGGKIQTRGASAPWVLSGVTVVGPRFSCDGDGQIVSDLGPGFVGPNYWPGSVAGTADSTSGYDGFRGSIPGVNTQTGASYTLALTDYAGIVEMNNAGPNTVKVPTNATVAFPIAAARISVVQIGTGATTVQGAIGVTVHNAGVLAGQWAEANLYQRAIDEWVMTV